MIKIKMIKKNRKICLGTTSAKMISLGFSDSRWTQTHKSCFSPDTMFDSLETTHRQKNNR